jgi:pimeloyl-ACP methyl ester carboxylesterase
MTTNRDADRRPPTLVFIHGTNSSSAWASGLTGELALRGHRCVAVDLPGHGREAFYPRSYQNPQDLEALATEPSRSRRSPSTTTSSASWMWCAVPAAMGP